MKTTSTYMRSLADADGTCDPARFTLINNTERSETELAEIVAATDTSLVADIAVLKPDRQALLYTFAVLQTEVKLKGDEHLENAVNQIYMNRVLPKIQELKTEEIKHLKALTEDNVEEAFARLTEGTLNPNNPVDNVVKEYHQEIQENIASGKYKPGQFSEGESIESITKKAAYDHLYKERLSRRIEDVLERVVHRAITEGVTIDLPKESIPLERLSTHSGSDRQTFMVAGPPACGKGTITAMFEEDAKRAGIGFDDVVKVNTDFYRRILSLAQPMGKDTTQHANLNNDEAGLVTDLTVARLKSKVNANNAPHILLDTVSIKQPKIDLGTANGGTMSIRVVTLDPEIAINRAIERGRQINRFVPVEYMLTAHRNVGQQLTKLLENNTGRNIEVQIYDTDVKFGELPILVEQVDLHNRRATIDFPEKAEAIFARAALAPNPDGVRYLDYKPEYPQIDTLRNGGYQAHAAPSYDASAFTGLLMLTRLFVGRNRTETEEAWRGWGHDVPRGGEAATPEEVKAFRERMNGYLGNINEKLHKEFEDVHKQVSKFAPEEKDSSNEEWAKVTEKISKLTEMQFELNDLQDKLNRKIDKGWCSKDVIRVGTYKLKEMQDILDGKKEKPEQQVTWSKYLRSFLHNDTYNAPTTAAAAHTPKRQPSTPVGKRK